MKSEGKHFGLVLWHLHSGTNVSGGSCHYENFFLKSSLHSDTLHGWIAVQFSCC